MKKNEQEAREWWKNYEKRYESMGGSSEILPPKDAVLAFACYLDSLKSKDEKPKIERLDFEDLRKQEGALEYTGNKNFHENLLIKINELVDHANKES